VTVIFPIWSTLVSDPETCSGIVAEPCLRDPIDCTMLDCCNAAATAPTVTLCAASLTGSSVTSTSSVGAPVITTDETPARPLSFGRAWARSWPDRSPRGSLAETAYSRIGRLLVEKVWIVEASAWGGSSDRILPSALLTSCSADLRSVPSLNRTITSDAPWLDVDCTVSAPATPCIAFPTGTPTC
jgi:hypothetical protein